jgi:predicted Rossmann-fold nucleotide-binding protein
LLEVWTARVLRLHDKPVVVLDPDGIFSPLQAQLELLVDRGFARQPAAEAVTWTRDVAAALDACARRPAPVGGSPIEHAEEVLEAEVADD